MIYIRGAAADYDEWAELTGDAAWSYEHVLPLFRRMEDNARGADRFHGAGGPLRVEDLRSPHPWTRCSSYRHSQKSLTTHRARAMTRSAALKANTRPSTISSPTVQRIPSRIMRNNFGGIAAETRVANSELFRQTARAATSRDGKGSPPKPKSPKPKRF